MSHLCKHKDRILKLAREKPPSVGLIVDFMKTRRQWGDIIKMLKENGCPLRILSLAKLSFRK
jgi:hypothetical protein